MRSVSASPALMRLLVRACVRSALGPRVPVRLQRWVLDTEAVVAAWVTAVPSGMARSLVSLGSRPARRFAATPADPSRAVLYLHGGAYITGSVRTHGGLAAHLAAAAGAPVYLLDYRLAPEYPFPAALDDAVDAFEALLASGIRADRIAVAGDSAGGGMALALAMRVRDSGGRLPAALALLSPWADATLAGVRADWHDPLLRRSWLARAAESYAGGHTVHPYVSPLRGDLQGLPPMLIHATSSEILRGDIERLAERARAVGVAVRYRELENSWHVAHLHAGLMTAATDAVVEAGTFLSDSTRALDA